MRMIMLKTTMWIVERIEGTRFYEWLNGIVISIFARMMVGLVNQGPGNFMVLDFTLGDQNYRAAIEKIRGDDHNKAEHIRVTDMTMKHVYEEEER